MFRRLSLILKIMVKLFEYPDAKSVAVCGDIHGDFHTLAGKMCVQYQMADTLFIVLGIAGLALTSLHLQLQLLNIFFI